MRSNLASLAAATALAAALSVGCNDTDLTRADARIEVSPESIAFGDVNLLSLVSEPITVTNVGTGWLEISGFEVAEESGSLFVATDPYTLVGAEDWTFSVSFAPTGEEHIAGSVYVYSNDPETPVLDIPVDGTGVRPILDVTPTALHFDTSDGVVTSSQTVVLESAGSGAVVVGEIAVLDDDQGAFSFALPPSVTLPYAIDPGLSVEVTVTHEPVIGESYGANLHIYSDDLNDEDQAVVISASGTGSGGEPPVVEITDPASGHAVEEGETVDFSGVVADADQDADTLVTYFQSDLQGNLGTVFPDAEGNVSLAGIELELGTHMVSLVAVDNQSNIASDTISVMVWEPGQTFDYTISGGDTEYHYFMVDDDITFYLNDVPIFVDTDGNQNLHPPVPVTAAVGDVLRIAAVDYVACTKALDGLYLHLNESNVQLLNDAMSVSACDDHEDYDEAYTGPWPNTFLDEQYVITIP
jgi:hypothetical protein